MAERRPMIGAKADLVLLHTGDQLDAAARLLWGVWGARTDAERTEVIGTSMLRTLAFSGNYVVGAYQDDELVGCTVGIFGAHKDSGRPDQLHSYIAGVAPGESNRGIGYAMKRHQRQWALEHGLDTILWTFDPLVARNAYFNLCKLGVTVTSYENDFYGEMNDGVNTNQNTDRLLVEWDLRSEWAGRAMQDDLGGRRRHACVPPEAELIVVPEDIGRLRDEQPELAQHERFAVRERFESLLSRGYRVVGMSKAREYVLLPAGVAGEFEA